MATKLCKVNNKILSVLKKASGENMNNVVLRFTDHGLVIKQTDGMQARYIVLELMKSSPVFAEYTYTEPTEKVIAIHEYYTFLSLLNLMTDAAGAELELSDDEMTLFMNAGSRQAVFTLISPEAIEDEKIVTLGNSLKIESNEYAKFKVPSTFFANVRKSTNMMKSSNVKLTIAEAKFSMTSATESDSSYKHAIIESVPIDVEPDIAVSASYNAGLIKEAIETLTVSDVEVFMSGPDHDTICFSEVDALSFKVKNYVTAIDESAEEKAEEK
jgi:hypothetical protein